MNPGDFTSVRTHGRPLMGIINIADLICRFTRSTKNHTISYYGPLNGVEMIGEAQPGGYRIVPLANYDGYELNWSTRAVPLTPAQSTIARKVMDSFAGANGGRGVPYNYLDIVDLFLALVLRFATPRAIKRRLASASRLICSQAADLIDQAMGIQLFTHILAGEVTPGMLDKYVDDHTPVAA